MLQKIIIGLAVIAIGFGLGKWLNQEQEPTTAITIREAKHADGSKPAIIHKNSEPFSYSQAVKKVAPSVVNIHTKITVHQRRSFFDDPIFDLFFGNRFAPQKRLQTSLGSGVIVSQDGYILTNNHVIKGADTILVSLNDSRNTTAILIGADPDTDLALLKINLDKITPITFGNSELVEVGDVTLAIGNPFGVGQTVTMGIVSATGRSELGIANQENFIQTDAAINPGNSGGALTNAKGELIGINIAIYSKSGASHGIGFAIPSNSAKNILQKIVTNGNTAMHGWLGVEIQNFSAELAGSFGVDKNIGVIVSGVYAGSPAANAGIKPGDILTHLNGRHIDTREKWSNAVSKLKLNANAQIILLREKRRYEVNVKSVLKHPDKKPVL